jgi:hypothetical protein
MHASIPYLFRDSKNSMAAAYAISSQKNKRALHALFQLHREIEHALLLTPPPMHSGRCCCRKKKQASTEDRSHTVQFVQRILRTVNSSHKLDLLPDSQMCKKSKRALQWR